MTRRCAFPTSNGRLTRLHRTCPLSFTKKEGNEYYELLNFLKWQKVDKPHPSMIPPFGDQSKMLRGAVAPNRIEEKLIEVNRKEEKIHAHGEHKNVFLNEDEFLKLAGVCGSEQKRYEYIERLSGWIAQVGAKKAANYSSHYATIANWVRRDQEKTGKPETGKKAAADEESILRVKEFLRKKRTERKRRREDRSK